MAYRNKKWYLVFFTGKNVVMGKVKQLGKGMTKDEASAFVSVNLERPSFKYEFENANDAFKEVYGMDYASPAEMRTISDREEIARLKAKLEAIEIEKRQAAAGAGADATDETAGDTGGDKQKDLLTAEQFKDKWIAENGTDVPLKRGRAWAKYKKENGIVE